MQPFLLLVAALGLTVLLIPPLAQHAARFGLLDRPGGRKTHREPVPRVGGIALFAGALLPLVAAVDPSSEIIALGAALMVLLIAGLCDDRSDLHWGVKLAAQAAACAIAVTFGDIRIESITLTERIPLPEVVVVPLTMLFLIGITNAINLADGLDGLAAGTTLLSVIAVGLIGFTTGDTFVTLAAGALCGALLGFLRFNTHPARIFMGDSGSQFLGFAVGVLAIHVTQNAGSAVSAAIPLLLLGWPVLDTLAVMAARLRAGQSPFVADRRHFHHRLLSLGLAHHEAVTAIYVVQGALFVCAYTLRFESDVAIIGCLLVFALLVLGGLHLAEARRWRWRVAPVGSALADPPGQGDWLRYPALLARMGVPACLLLYALLVTANVARLPSDIGLLACALLATQVIALAFVMPKGLLDQPVAYVLAAILVYLDQRGDGLLAPDSGITTALFAALLAFVLVRFCLDRRRRFELTPLDAIVAFVAVAVPMFIAGFDPDLRFGIAIAKFAILCYAIEFVSTDGWSARLPRAVVVLTLPMLVLRATAGIA